MCLQLRGNVHDQGVARYVFKEELKRHSFSWPRNINLTSRAFKGSSRSSQAHLENHLKLMCVLCVLLV